jgi:hypothetical protein
MHELNLSSTRDAALLAVPFIALVALAVFRLDTFFTASKNPEKPGQRRRAGCGMDENGDPLLVDPDGTPSHSNGRRRTDRPKRR